MAPYIPNLIPGWDNGRIHARTNYVRGKSFQLLRLITQRQSATLQTHGVPFCNTQTPIDISKHNLYAVWGQQSFNTENGFISTECQRFPTYSLAFQRAFPRVMEVRSTAFHLISGLRDLQCKQ
jgi:hypothetical protein